MCDSGGAHGCKPCNAASGGAPDDEIEEDGAGAPNPFNASA